MCENWCKQYQFANFIFRVLYWTNSLNYKYHDWWCFKLSHQSAHMQDLCTKIPDNYISPIFSRLVKRAISHNSLLTQINITNFKLLGAMIWNSLYILRYIIYNHCLYVYANTPAWIHCLTCIDVYLYKIEILSMKM